MFLFFQKHGDKLPEWNPFRPVAKILSDIGLTEDEVSLFEAPFEEFRHQNHDSPLRLPEDIRPSEEWFRLLFCPVEGIVSQVSVSGNPTIIGITDKEGHFSHQDIEEIEGQGIPVKGYFGQVNLDNIGRDFLCLVYFRQKVLDLYREGGLRLVLSQVLRRQAGIPPEHTSLNNSLIPVEAVIDDLTLRGYDFGSLERTGPMRIFSDPPERHLSIREIPDPSIMLRDSANLSRYIRNLSVILQDGGEWEDLTRVSCRRFNLDREFSLFRDKREGATTDIFARRVAMSREFDLWDTLRERKLPSVRTISEEKGIPYLELVRTIWEWSQNPLRFEGLDFIRTGLSDRMSLIFEREIVSGQKTIDNNSPKS